MEPRHESDITGTRDDGDLATCGGVHQPPRRWAPVLMSMPATGRRNVRRHRVCRDMSTRRQSVSMKVSPPTAVCTSSRIAEPRGAVCPSWPSPLKYCCTAGAAASTWTTMDIYHQPELAGRRQGQSRLGPCMQRVN